MAANVVAGAPKRAGFGTRAIQRFGIVCISRTAGVVFFGVSAYFGFFRAKNAVRWSHGIVLIGVIGVIGWRVFC